MFDIISDSDRLALLKNQIGYARSHSRYYGETLNDISISKLTDLKSIPLMSSRDIISRGRDTICVSASEIERIVSLRSSGTEALPKRLCFTEADLGRTVGFFRDGMGRICGRGDKTAIMLPFSSPNGVGDLLKRALSELGAEPICIGTVKSELELEALNGSAPDVIVGMPWQVRLAAMRYPGLHVKKVLLSADYVPEGICGFIESIWGCECLRHYGLTETGYGCAVETVRGGGMILRADELIAEVIDPETGEVLPDGSIGELVLTTLRREAMPLIRYRTGDIAYLSDDGRKIDRIFGRIGTERSFYQLQDALCTEEQLYDYREDEHSITAFVKDGAEESVKRILSGLTGKDVDISASCMCAYSEKRNFSY